MPDPTPAPTPNPKRPRHGDLVVFLVIALACTAVWVRLKYAPAPKARVLPDFGAAPEFLLTERDGTAVGSEALRGRIWIADFIFTRCAGTCPLLSTQMKTLQDSLRKEDGIRLVSFSVDSVNDTPEALNKYADRFGAQLGRWLFLRGEPGVVNRIAVEGFKLAAGTLSGDADAPGDPSVVAGDPVILHSSRLVLVDKAGHIRGYYDGTDEEKARVLVSDIGALLRAEKSKE